MVVRSRVVNLYKSGSTITGRLRKATTVKYKDVFSRREKITLLLFLLLVIISSGGLAAYLFSTLIISGFNLFLSVAVGLALLVECIRVLQSLTLLVFAYFAKDPVPMIPGRGLRLAVLTTIVPGKEPFELVAKTLEAMKRIDPGKGNTLDVWLLDEGNDPGIKAQCAAMGVKHFSRKGKSKWNTSKGAFRARTKHGNHNAWRSKYENDYDIVAQMDPDHVPRINFITRTLGYFRDPDVAFVVAPQVYGNIESNWIANGSAFQAYVFHGIIQRGGNGLGAPLLIGTNHLYRTKAFKQINGYQDSIIEDHLTSMIVFGAKNKATGENWKGVYTPDIVAVGEGPASFTDYFNQQKRWAYGIWEIATKSTANAIKTMSKRQALVFLMLQFFYPSVALSWVASSITTVAFAVLPRSVNANIGPEILLLWLYSLASGLGLFFWLRRFNLMEHERQDWGIRGMGLLLMCIPVYVSAAIQALSRKPLTYAVTAKGNLTSPDNLKTFSPHFQWVAVNIAALLPLAILSNGTFTPSIDWTLEHIAVCTVPISIYAAGRTSPWRKHLRLRSFLKLAKRTTLRPVFSRS